ncbi:MAG: hypothetical protein U1E04_06620 [Hylemonella sp.]|nr:hypothetical protein [Hylemonella sp.]
MSEQQLIFAVLYQVPAVLIGLTLSFLIPSPPVRAIFVLPGTFVHEMLHFLVGLVLNAKPVSFSVWPRKSGSSTWTMGSVGFSNVRWYNGAAVGLAPLLAPVAATWFAPGAADWQIGLGDLKYWALAAPVLSMCLPSWADLKICLASAVPMTAILALLYWRFS